MTRNIDDLMRRLAARPSNLCLDGFEDSVWRRVAVARDRRRANRLRVMTVGAALAVGVAGGGIGAAGQAERPAEIEVFSVTASLSPLGELEIGS